MAKKSKKDTPISVVLILKNDYKLRKKLRQKVARGVIHHYGTTTGIDTGSTTPS
jgi:hypothetical protein